MSLPGKLIDSLLANAPQLKVLPISVALGNGRGVCQRLQLFGRTGQNHMPEQSDWSHLDSNTLARSSALRVCGAGDDKDGNVNENAVGGMVANQMDAEAFDISLTVARDDRALAVAGGFAAKRRRSMGQSHLRAGSARHPRPRLLVSGRGFGDRSRRKNH